MNINISAKEVDFNQYLIVDIRTREEIQQLSLNDTYLYPIDFNTANEDEVKEDFYNLYKNNDKKILIMCRSGARSSMLCEFLNQDKIIAYNLLGGIIAMCENYPNKIKK